jgi:hypothetical protein
MSGHASPSVPSEQPRSSKGCRHECVIARVASSLCAPWCWRGVRNCSAHRLHDGHCSPVRLAALAHRCGQLRVRRVLLGCRGGLRPHGWLARLLGCACRAPHLPYSSRQRRLAVARSRRARCPVPPRSPGLRRTIHAAVAVVGKCCGGIHSDRLHRGVPTAPSQAQPTTRSSGQRGQAMAFPDPRARCESVKRSRPRSLRQLCETSHLRASRHSPTKRQLFRNRLAAKPHPLPPNSQVNSDTQSWFGRSAQNCRSTLSSGHGASRSLIAVRINFPRMTPRRPSLRIRRSTVHRAASMPSRSGCGHTMSAP